MKAGVSGTRRLLFVTVHAGRVLPGHAKLGQPEVEKTFRWGNGITLQPGVSAKLAGACNAHDQIAPAAVSGLPRLQHYCGDQAALPPAPQRRFGAALRLDRKRRRGRWPERRVETLGRK